MTLGLENTVDGERHDGGLINQFITGVTEIVGERGVLQSCVNIWLLMHSLSHHILTLFNSPWLG
ncbi:hypothetical protein [Klebsiella pneumoniae IS53]|nr:hypothetical protein [Klebsiella pneumoniae IS53]VXZ86991.1 Uncharacterised protein [Klebsiella pneumoniae]